MVRITEIEELKKRQRDRDESVEAEAAKMKASHPHENLVGRPLKLVHTQAGPTDCECGSVCFRVRDASTGREEWCCRDCVNAVRKLSLRHDPASPFICVNCEFTTDSLGLVNAANHVTMAVLDGIRNGVVVPGLTSLIAAGKVDLDSTTGRITVN